jgi:hypothetical protein
MMFNLRAKRSIQSEKMISVRLIQWLIAIFLILFVTSGLWKSVFAQAYSSANDEFIPVAIRSAKSADYSQELMSHNFRTISLAIVTDILRDEEILFADQYHQRLEEFFEELKKPIPSANPLSSIQPPQTVAQISSLIDEEGIVKQTVPASDSPEDEGYVDRDWPTTPLIVGDIQYPSTDPDGGFIDGPWPTSPLVLTNLSIPTSSTPDSKDGDNSTQDDGPDPDGGDTGGVSSGGDVGEDSNGGDAGGDSSGGDVGEDTGGGDAGGDGDDDDGDDGKNKNDDKDGDPNDGNAGKGNDDKDKKDKKDKDK